MATNKKNYATKEQRSLTSWEDYIDSKYGEIGTPQREESEKEFEVLMVSVLSRKAKVTRRRIYEKKS
jgi:hypothetical protein